MPPKDYESGVTDFTGIKYEFFSATFQRGSIPNAYHIFISGVNENGFTSVDNDFINLRETSPVKAIQDMGFKISSRDSIAAMRKVGRFGDYHNLTIIVRRS